MSHSIRQDALLHTLRSFALDGEVASCTPYGGGHINSTHLVTDCTGTRYILQRINKYVFKDPVKVMANASAVTNFLRQRNDDPRSALHYIPTLKGNYYHRDREGEFWRMYDFVGGFCLGLKCCQFGFYLREERLVFSIFLLLLAQTALHSLQIDLYIGDLLHHCGFMEDAEGYSCAAKQQCSHQNGGKNAG